MAKLSVPINIKYIEIETIRIEFLDLNSNANVKLADMRLCYAPISKFYITNLDGTRKCTIDDIYRIHYTSIDNYGDLKSVTKDFFVTENDICLSYLNGFKESDGSYFVLSYCNNTKKMNVRNVIFYTYNDSFMLNFNSEVSGNNDLLQFYNELISPDGKTITRQIPNYIKNIENINESYIRFITVIERDNMTSYLEKDFDLKGKLMMEQDEHGVQIVYSYDTYGLLSYKTIQYKDNTNTEKIIFSASNSHFSDFEEDYKSDLKTYYNDLFGNIETIEYNGKNESYDNRLLTTFSYNKFFDNVIKIENDIDNNSCGKNNMHYDSSGKIIEITPFSWNDDKMYGYKFIYNIFGEPYRYYLVNKDSIQKNNELLNNLLIEKNVIRQDNKIITKFYRDNDNPDSKIASLDKYGRIKSLIEGEIITTFNKQNINESESLTKVISFLDPYEERKYLYNYNNYNQLTSYKIINDDNMKLDFLTITATGASRIKYERIPLGTTMEFESEIFYENNKLLQPRIIKSKNFIDRVITHSGGTKEECRDETIYTYDKLGRINRKEHKIFDALFENYTGLIENIIYKPDTFLKQNKTIKLINPSIKDTEYKFDVSYDNRGNLKTSTLKYTCGDKTNSEILSYNFDNANRLVSENKEDIVNNKNIFNKNYTYNLDGSLDTITSNGKTTKYEYDKGRMSSFYYSDNPQNKNTFTYDNLGNCIKFLSHDLEWYRGNLLTKYCTPTQSASYFYNSQGIRFKKEVHEGGNSDVINYYYDGPKLLAEYCPAFSLRYMYDIDEIIGFMTHKSYPYHYVKDTQGSVIAIIDNDIEVARYEYDAWGNCTIVKDNIEKIGLLNPIRWKSHYFDRESGLYYIGGRYYSPIMRQFISPCNYEDMMYNSIIIGRLNPYIIGNPLHFYVNSYNIFTSIPLVPENNSDNDWDLPEWARITLGIFIIGGSIVIGGIPALIGVGVGAVVGAGFEMYRQSSNNGINDWSAIGWSAFGGAVAGGVGSMVNGANYAVTFILGGAGTVAGGTVTGNVNNWNSAAMFYGIGAVLNMTGKFIGDKVANGVNRLIGNRASEELSTPIYKMVGDTLKEVFEGANYATPIGQQFINQSHSLVLRQMGYWSQTLWYNLLNQSVSGLVTGFY